MAQAAASKDPTRPQRLRALALSLHADGRRDDALALLEQLAELHPHDPDTLLPFARALGASGRVLDALSALTAVRAAAPGDMNLAEEIRAQAPLAIARYNDSLARGNVIEAEKYASALAGLVPHYPPMLAAALQCHSALGHKDETARLARALIAADPGNVAAHTVLLEDCREKGDVEGESEHRMALALSPKNDLIPLVRLRDIHDAASAILCRRLTLKGLDQVHSLLSAARDLTVPAEPASEWAAWEKHYRLLLAAIDLPMVVHPLAAEPDTTDIAFLSSTGKRLDLASLNATADRLGAEAVFFVAADENYVELYARWYALSVRKFCDVKFLIVIYVIGGADRLAHAAESVGIEDERLVFAGDRFAAEKVTTRCYDAPPKGLAKRPLAHFQCHRFLRAGRMLALKRPVFVSDIDLILQRGVRDLLDRHAGDDLVLNENTGNANAGSRITANLLLLNPTPNAAFYLDFLRLYLEKTLAGAEVTRWVDQVGLLLARHHLLIRGRDAKIGYFDTTSDINNVMYRSYQEHPFRFLSLYHGFDTSSLEDDPRVLGGEIDRQRHSRSSGTGPAVAGHASAI